MEQYLRFILSLFLTFTSAQPAFAQTKVDGSLLKGDVIGGTASNTRRIVVPKDTKANLDAKTRLEANLVYGTDTKKAYIDNGTDLIAVGSGSGGAVNLITDGDAENATSSIFVPYKDAAASRPVDGVGSSADVTTAVTSTAPLTGAKSFTITKDAVNRQGQGWSIPFTVPLSMQAKVLQIEVDYIVNSGTFVAGSSSADSDVIWYLYDITNSTLIEPSSIKLLSNSSTLSDKFRSTFQTSATGTSYRLIAHVATTSAAAYTLKVEASVSPSVYVYGTPVTDYTLQQTAPVITGSASGTLNIGTGGSPVNTVEVARIGPEISARYTLRVGTAGTADIVGALQLPLPIGYTTSLVNFDVIGYGEISVAGSANPTARLVAKLFNNKIILDNSDSTLLGAGGSYFSNANTLSVVVKFKAVGLSASVQMSDSYDGRVISFLGAGTGSTQALTANVTNISFTSVADKTNSWTGSTYIVPSAGDFNLSAFVYSGATSFSVMPHLNGVSYGKWLLYSPAGLGGSGNLLMPNLKAGDIVSLRSNITATLAADTAQSISIERISGPSAIAASESINLSYSSSTTGSIGTSATLQSFATKAYDTHGAWSGSVFTAPIAGKYQIAANVLTASVTLSATQELVLLVYKNGSSYRRLDTTLGNGSGVSYSAQGITTVDLLAGETLSIYASSAVATTQQGSGTFTFVSIERVGN